MGGNVGNAFVGNELGIALNNNNNKGNTTMNMNISNSNAMTENNSGLPATGLLACVEFKRGRIRKYHCEREDIEPGTYVLVDGDRGTDCGLLVQTTKQLPNGSRAVTSMDGCDVKDEKVKLENGRVIRPASNEDIERLHNIIANAEAVALKTCRQRCEELGIEINLIDVEYQFDMKKISFFFDCDHSVDFRGLVRELYRTFGARIWMENVNPKVKNAMPDGSTGNSNNNNNNNNSNNNNNNNGNTNNNNNSNTSMSGSGNNYSNGGTSGNAHPDNNVNSANTNSYVNGGSGSSNIRNNSNGGKERMHYDSQGNAPRGHHGNYRRRY